METVIEQKIDPPDECLFEMNHLVTVSSIRLAARSAVGSKQILAFIMGNGDLSLHFIKNENSEKPIMRHIPWFCDTNRHPSALCFDPSGNWLLLTGYDSTIFIIPALALVDGTEVQDHRWSTTDVTVFPPASPSTSGQRTTSWPRPTAVVWWQSIMGCHHTAIVGHEGGIVTFISLATGVQVGCTYVKESISSLHICQDNSLDIVFLLITCSSKAQWKLVLEQRTTGYTWPVDSAVSVSKVTNSGHLLEPDGANRSMPRSRLQGLKQLSVEKLASIRHKLAETRSRGVSAVQTRRESSSSSSDEAAASLNRKSSSASSTATDSNSTYTTTGPLPEALGVQVGDTFLLPQYARGRYLLSGYYAPSSILTIHGMDLNVVPLFVHKLPPDCGDILVTDRFLYITDSKGEQLFVGSTQLSECRLDGDCDYNPDSIMNTFTFGGDERILYLFKRSVKSTQSKESTTKHHHRSSDYERSESRKSAHKKQQMCEEERQASEFKLPQAVSDLKIDLPQIDTVIVVTNRGIYEVNLKRSATEIFMELVLKMQEVERAEKIALIFGLNLQQLLEMAGDLKLAEKDFPQAIALYKLSRCRHLKSVLKFAVAGHSAELLGYVNLLLETSGLDLTTPERIHLANIAVMAHSEQVLRATIGKTGLLKKYLKFLQDNKYYDEVLAVNVAGQTGLWDVLQFLSQQRGLQPEVIDVLVKMFRPQNTSSLHQSQKLGMWMCVSDPSLLQALICRPLLASQHIKFVSSHLSELEMLILERLANLYDPSSPVLRPAILQMFTARKRSQSCSSTVSNQESIELSEVNEEITIPLEKMIHLFLLILLHMEKQRCEEYTYNMELMEKVDLKPNCLQKNKSCVQLQLNHLSAGFAHVALVRNASVYSWGNAVNGCLGLGPTMSRYGTPQLLPLFPTLKLHVFAVSCGRNHTLALTNNGVYSWGSSQYGQLGLGPGRTGQTPAPCLVMGLAEEQIVAISTGQYHSLALTEDGRVFSWGWGVHGQLGLKLIENVHSPEPMKLLSHKIVTHIYGGYGHSLMLTSDGEVYACGSSVFGQLGNGTNIKSSVPIMVSAIPEPCILISTAYFHNLALGKSQKLYIWGSSPQVLRIQAQAQKKARLMQQQSPPTEKPGTSSGLQTDIGSSGLVVSPTMEFKGLASIGCDINTSQNNAVSSPNHILHHDVGEDKEGQHHLLPKVVDTSLVNGKIKQLSCGCHHSALLTSDGNLYLWGRNLDGQLGSGSRKEVLIPTPMIPAKKSPTQSAVGGIPEQCHLQQVSCGCEFTTALEADRGRLWTWGNNSFGQLGKAPAEEGKSLEGRLVMLKTSKRVIKLPHGAHNASDLPQEVLGIPSNIITFQSQPLAAFKSPPCPILKNAENPPYGAHTLHFALQHFHGCYESSTLLSKCLELENFQAAAKISTLDRQYHLALCYQLKAFALASSKIMEKYKILLNEEELKSKNNDDGCLISDNTAVDKSLNENSASNTEQLNKTNDEISEKNKVITSESNVDGEVKDLQSTTCVINDTEVTPSNNTSTTEENSEEKYLVNGDEGSVHKIDSSTDKSMDSLPTMPSNSPEQSNSCEYQAIETPEEAQNDIVGEKQSFSVTSTPESLASSEIHAFAIQGGTEEMSEENRYMTSPESPQLIIAGLQTPDLTSSLRKEEGPFVHPDIVGTTNNIINTTTNRSHLTYSRTPELLQVQKPNVEKSNLVTNEKHIKEVNNCSNEEKSILLNEISSQNVQNDILNPTNTKETKKRTDNACEDFLISKAAAIVEYHVSVMEEDSHTMMSRLLQQGIDFWMAHSLPVESLECLLLKHMTKLFYPLGFQLFCKENSSDVLNNLSPQFCLQLCSSLITSLEQKKAPNDFIELLVQSLTSLNSSNGQFLGPEPSHNSLDMFVSELLSGGLSSLTIHPQQSAEVLSLDSRNIFAFSCGHHYSKPSVDIPQWPATANLLQGFYNTEHSRILPLACPRCVLGHIENKQSTKA